MAVDPVWHKEQIEKYHGEFPHYKVFAKALRNVLEKACNVYAPEAIVQTRAKPLSSFAEKAVRRANKTRDPALQFTDLCGARVICNTKSEVEKICEFIEQNFTVDEEHSEGRKSRQAIYEFGYSTVHYVVQLRHDELIGIRLPRDIIGRRKAEIQVRTLLQHAWASVSHDQFYKAAFIPPERLERSMARLSALLEEADHCFARVMGDLGRYRVNYGANLKKETITKELATLACILDNESDKKSRIHVSLRIARLAGIACDWERVVATLSPFIGAISKMPAEVLLEYGHGLCRLHTDTPQGALYKKGQAMLKKAADRKEERTYVRALLLLAFSYKKLSRRENQVKMLLHEAYKTDPLNPFVLVPYLEYELISKQDGHTSDILRNTLIHAIDTCRSHIDAGIEMPWAFLAMGRFYLFLDDTDRSLSAYMKAIHLCQAEDACIDEEIFNDELMFVQSFKGNKKYSDACRWIEQLLLLGKSAVFHSGKPLRELEEMATRKMSFMKPVLIVAGGAARDVDADMKSYGDMLQKAMQGVEGTVISGGTTSGIPGIVGAVASAHKKEGKKSFQLLAYVPHSLPDDATIDERYDEHVRAGKKEFSPEQPLQSWTDLIATGIDPSAIRLICINGGRIAAFECRLALALGAKVGIVTSSGRATSWLLADKDWLDAIKLLLLPHDSLSVRAFVNPGKTVMTEVLLDEMGEAIHNEFLNNKRKDSLDPVMLPWSLLPDDIRISNRGQATYLEEVLRAAGYGIRKSTGEEGVKEFGHREVKMMAEMEHGRWVVERLQSGWHYGPEKDVKKKISPYLIPWNDLTDEVKGYDKKAVIKWPEILGLSGLEIYRLAQPSKRNRKTTKSILKTRKKENR
jgi:ppGpp synthetase/RelA/SpoT-type nucleotidyltranferase